MGSLFLQQNSNFCMNCDNFIGYSDSCLAFYDLFLAYVAFNFSDLFLAYFDLFLLSRGIVWLVLFESVFTAPPPLPRPLTVTS